MTFLVTVAITAGIFAWIGWVSYSRAMAVAPTCDRKRDRPADDFFKSGRRLELASRTDKVRLSAVWFGAAQANRAIVMTHGLDECLDDSRFIAAARIFRQTGLSVLMVEMRNHGQSERTNGLHGFGSAAALDLLGGWDWVRAQGYGPSSIALYGQSLGGSAALYAGWQEPQVAAIVADSPIVRIDWALIDGGAPGFFVPILKIVGSLRGFAFWSDPAEIFFSRPKQSVLIIHSLDDQTTPVKHARYLAKHNRYPETKKVVEITGVGHITLAQDRPELFQAIVVPFLERNLPHSGVL